MEANPVVRKLAGNHIDPRGAIAQHAGLPAGKGAVLCPEPGGGRDANLLSGAFKVQVIKIDDRAILGGHPDGIRKGGALIALLRAVEVDGASLDGELALVGDRRKVEVYHRGHGHLFRNLVHQSLQLLHSVHRVVLIVIVIGFNGSHRNFLPQFDGIAVVHVKGPQQLCRITSAGVIQQRNQGGFRSTFQVFRL